MAYKNLRSISATEREMQFTLVDWLKINHILHSHNPNEGKRHPITGHILNRMGMQKGFPDLFLPYARSNYHGLFIELKRDEKAKLTIHQQKWLDILNAQQYKALRCNGLDEAMNTIVEYLGK